MKRKMTIGELRNLIRESVLSEAAPGEDLATKAARRLGMVGTGELGPADFEAVKVELVEDGIATEAEVDALDYDEVLSIRGRLDDDGDFEDVAPEGGTFDVGAGKEREMFIQDGDADDDGVPDALEERAADLVYSMVERFESDPELAVMIVANALIGKSPGDGEISRKGFPIESVKSALSKWIQMDHEDAPPMTESKTSTRWEDLAGLLKG